MKENLTNLTGLRLVIDQKEQEFYLFSDVDSGPGMIHGKIGAAIYNYNVKRGSTDDGIFSGDLQVSRIPFEYTKYSDAKIKHLLDAHTNDESQSQKQDTNTVEHKDYEFFDPDKFISGEITKAPKLLSRKNRSKWWNEMKDWKAQDEKHKKILTGEVKGEDNSGTTTNNNSSDTNSNDSPTADPLPVQEDKKPSKNEEKMKLIAYLGKGNELTKLGSTPEGYMLAYYDPRGNYFAVLGTPQIVLNGQDRGKAFFMCQKQKTAEQLLTKLKEEPFYAKFVVDGEKECKVRPITDLPVDKWEAPALLVNDVYSFMNSELMLTVQP